MDTHQGHVPTLGTHHGPPYCTRYPPAEVVGGEESRGHLRALQVKPQLHLRKRQPLLRQRKHPPAMGSGDDPRGGKTPIS
jgi:hypothetical protein